ncbi:MAG: hypothetical protein JW717_03625 [Marinilabiliaceae bacterium]|nr:hypothetical protein [Marinilabiliaceae bacterium]
MRKLLCKSGLFLVFFICFFIGVNVLYVTLVMMSEFGVKKRIEFLKFKNPDYELIVIGASTTLDGIDAGYLTSKGIKSYNTAIGGSTVKTNYIQLLEYIEKCSVMPKYVLLGLNSGMVKSFDDSGVHPIVEVTMKGHKYSLNDVPILKFRWLGFEFFKKIISKSHREVTMELGQLKFRKTIADKTNYANKHLNVDEFSNSLWIAKIAELCIENNIQLMVVEMPGYKVSQNNSDTGPYSLKFKSGNVKLLNLNSQSFCKIFIDDKDWIGNSHLNIYGAEKLTARLYEYVIE